MSYNIFVKTNTKCSKQVLFELFTNREWKQDTKYMQFQPKKIQKTSTPKIDTPLWLQSSQALPHLDQ